MAFLLQIDKVSYKCSCDRWESLARLYFCRHCTLLRCRDCVTHEIDSTFCPSCMENMLSGEARVKMNRCTNCYECPVCTMTLTIKATSGAQVADSDNKNSAKEYYMQCPFCRWSTREAGIPDQNTPLSGWPVHTNHNQTQMANLLEQFKVFASVEKAEREQKKYTKRRSNIGMFSDKFNLQAIYNRRRISFTDGIEKAVVPINASDKVPELDENIFVEEILPESVIKVDERIAQPLTRDAELGNFYPVRKPLMIRRSLRCRECDHNLCKGEYNPSSIHFKLHMVALLYVPDVRLRIPPSLNPDNQSIPVELVISNSSANLTRVVLLPDMETLQNEHFVLTNFPTGQLTIPSMDSTTDFDESLNGNHPSFVDDPKVVTFRKRHKLGIILSVQPRTRVGEVWLSFIIKYEYINSILTSSADRKGSEETQLLQQSVKINLGFWGENK